MYYSKTKTHPEIFATHLYCESCTHHLCFWNSSFFIKKKQRKPTKNVLVRLMKFKSLSGGEISYQILSYKDPCTCTGSTFMHTSVDQLWNLSSK